MRKIYTVLGGGIILGLGINGPLTEPTHIPLQFINTMVRKGRVIYQHNPYNTKEKVLVTPENASTIDFHPIKVKKEEVVNDVVVEEHVTTDDVEQTTTEQTTNNSYQQYNSKKNKKHKHGNNNTNNTNETTNVPIVDVETVEPLKAGDAFENVNYNDTVK